MSDWLNSMLRGPAFGGDFGTLEYWGRCQQASTQSLAYMASLASNAYPPPPARPRNIDPKRRMTSCQAEAFNRHGLLRSAP